MAKLRIRRRKPRAGNKRTAAGERRPWLTPKRRNAVFGIALVLILGLGGTLLYYVDENRRQQEALAELMLTQDELQNEIQDLNETKDKLDRELMQKNLSLREKQAEVQRLLKRIRFLEGQVQAYIKQGKLLEEEKEKFKGKYEQLLYYNKKYRRQLTALEKENRKLRRELAQARSSTDSLSQQTERLEGELMKKNLEVESMKVLQAIAFHYEALKRQDKVASEGEELESRGLRRKLRVCFKLIPNDKARKGPRELFLVVRGPDGEVIHNFAGGTSGHFEHNGNKLTYTAKTAIEYDGEGQRACIEYPKPAEYYFPEGEYAVTIYADGYLIGQDEFRVH